MVTKRELKPKIERIILIFLYVNYLSRNKLFSRKPNIFSANAYFIFARRFLFSHPDKGSTFREGHFLSNSISNARLKRKFRPELFIYKKVLFKA